jgi:hypothetical protein
LTMRLENKPKIEADEPLSSCSCSVVAVPTCYD